MKYAIVIPDGAADEPSGVLGGKTPLQAASTPEMDRIAREGISARRATSPTGSSPPATSRRSAFSATTQNSTTPVGPLWKPPRWATFWPRRLGRSMQPDDHSRRQDDRLHRRPHLQRGGRQAHGLAGPGSPIGRVSDRVSRRGKLSQPHDRAVEVRTRRCSAMTRDDPTSRRSGPAGRRTFASGYGRRHS